VVTTVTRLALAGLFLASGIAHLVRPGLYRPIMPSALPSPETLILISGVAEIAGGAGLLSTRLRRAAGAGLILLLVAVFPANVEMLRLHRRRGGAGWLEALLWARLPLQALLIWVTWRVSRAPRLPPAS
jgi:uncharacterized membrane protein